VVVPIGVSLRVGVGVLVYVALAVGVFVGVPLTGNRSLISLAINRSPSLCTEKVSNRFPFNRVRPLLP
jgi:hypothetical protein